MMTPETAFPEYDFTFQVLSTHFEPCSLTVKFTPVDTRLTATEVRVPLDATFDPANLKPYLAKYAPNRRWFGQLVLLEHGEALVGKEG